MELGVELELDNKCIMLRTSEESLRKAREQICPMSSYYKKDAMCRLYTFLYISRYALHITLHCTA